MTVLKLMKKKKGSTIIISIFVLVLVTTVILGVSNIFVNKTYTLKNINNYYDKKILEYLHSKNN